MRLHHGCSRDLFVISPCLVMHAIRWLDQSPGLLVLFLFSGFWTTLPLSAADFSYAQIQGDDSGPTPYGAVTVVSPFGENPDAAIPMFVLVDSGDYSSPWIRARRIAEILPKVAELVLFRGESVKVDRDPEGRPALFVGPTQESSGANMRIMSVLPGDVKRFQQEENKRNSGRVITDSLVAQYWQNLLVDFVTLFIRYPLTRQEKQIVGLLNLIDTEAGIIFKRMLIEIAVLLKYENVPPEKVTTEILRSKFGEVIRSMSREHWERLTSLAFRVPLEFSPESPGGSQGKSGKSGDSFSSPGRDTRTRP